MEFKSEAQKRWYFANFGNGSGGSLVSHPDGSYVHTIRVNGVDRHMILNRADDATAEENAEISMKEIRKGQY